MKLLWITLSLSALMCTTCIEAREVANNDSHKNRSFWNPITLNNFTPFTVKYKFGGGFVHHISSNSPDIYHSKIFSSHQSIWFSSWTESNGVLSISRRFLPNQYNTEKIATINIKIFNDIQVICLDGSTTSCIAK